jgi:hypothetical protein
LCTLVAEDEDEEDEDLQGGDEAPDSEHHEEEGEKGSKERGYSRPRQCGKLTTPIVYVPPTASIYVD